MKNTILLLLLFAISKSWAQPGGGGGLIINKIYDENLRLIKLDKSNIKVEFTVLDSLMNIINKYEIDYKKQLYIRPLNGYAHSIQRSGILIKYKKKEYRIDFENIWTQNGNGSKERIDSLVLFKPYILSKRNYSNSFHIGFTRLYSLSQTFLRNGITQHTYNKLSELDLIFDSKDYANNRKPKQWMEDYQRLYITYREGDYKFKGKGIKNILSELEIIIEKYGLLAPFALFKMELLYELKCYKELTNVYEKLPFEYDNSLTYINKMLIKSYVSCTSYNKAINICKISSQKQYNFNKECYYIYAYHRLFIEIYYQNKNRNKEIGALLTSLNEKEYSQYYGKEIFEQLKILKAYNTFKFGDKKNGIEQMSIYDKKCIPNPILKDVYQLLNVIENPCDYCYSLWFGIFVDIL